MLNIIEVIRVLSLNSFINIAVVVESGPMGLRSSVIESSNHVTVTIKQQDVQEPVAVVSMACRLPGDSNSPAAL